MYKYLSLIPKDPFIIQIGIDDESPMTLFIDVNNGGFIGSGSMYFDCFSLKKMQKDFLDFLDCKIDLFEIKNTDSNEYYIQITRIKYSIEIKGKIGNYTDQSLEFCVSFFEEEMVEKTKIINLINQIKI